MEQNPPDVEQFERKLPLQQEILRQIREFVPLRWDMPVLEIKITNDQFQRFESMNARVYNLAGDEELSNLPEHLLAVAREFHALCLSFGEPWIQCMLTLTVEKTGRLAKHQWNYQYHHIGSRPPRFEIGNPAHA